MIKQQSLVIAKLPNAGLGNKLFIWARALIFAHINQLPLYIIGLNRIHIGPLLRGEKVKRFYLGQFKRNTLNIHATYLYHLLNNTTKVLEPAIQKCTCNEPKVYVFSSIPSWKNYFESIHPYRNLIIDEFQNILSNKVRKKLVNVQHPAIGIHIRMGDFKCLSVGEEFSNFGLTRTPLNYFVKCIRTIRNKYKAGIKVDIFSDGFKSELEEVLNIADVTLNDPDLDVVDLIKLSRSKIIISSAHSSFSEWAGFLSDAAIIRHPDHIHGKIRTENNLFEGTISQFQSMP